MTLPDLQPLLANAPWAAVLIICAPILAIVVMVAICVWSVPKPDRVEAIKAAAEVVRAMKPGKPKQ